jgi:hypothetical protein
MDLNSRFLDSMDILHFTFYIFSTFLFIFSFLTLFYKNMREINNRIFINKFPSKNLFFKISNIDLYYKNKLSHH